MAGKGREMRRGMWSRGARLVSWGVVASALGVAVSWGASTPHSSYTPPEFAQPVTLSSKNGVLEVSLFVRQGRAALNTVASPVTNFLLFGYEVERGTASNGQRTGANLYPGPTLQVSPGETLIVHVVNELADLTIPDFYDPAFVAKGRPVPLYPRQLTSSPFNLHTHGLHVSPAGNADNVLLDIPAGYTNTYTYRIPPDHTQGLYWYHSHRHTLTTQQTYLGLAGMLSIGRSDGGIPTVTDKALPIRNMAIQYNYVFDRQGGQAILNNLTWPQWVSTLKPPEGSALADGSYVPTMVPRNFWQSKTGTQFFTIWWSGPLDIDNTRGAFQFLPSNLQSFTGASGRPTVAANPALPDHLRDLQFTINGLFEPVLHAKPGQTEIWVLANMSDMAYANVTLTETATGRHPPIAIVGQDGNPSPAVHYPFTDDGTTLVIPPGSRYAIAVTMPSKGDLVLEMPPAAGLKPMSRSGVLYTNDGTDHPPAVLGTISVEPAAISYFDGFFVSPTQVLARVKPEAGKGVTVQFVAGQPVGAHAYFSDLQRIKPAVERELVVSGGFKNERASDQDPKAFVYAFDDNTFPNTPLLQPRLGSVEQWSFVNNNNDEHPMHIHVNDFQVMSIVDAARGTATGVQLWSEDNGNVPAPLLGPRESVIKPGTLALRTEFTEFTGAYVIHCHRLNHEDNGLMAFVNVIPAVSSFAVAASGSPGHDAVVRVYDGNGNAPLATVTPFPGFEGSLSATMGDVDGDQILDLVVGKGAGGTPEVVVYSGAAKSGASPFTSELLRFLAFDASFSGGVRVAAADIDGNAMADNVIVGSGAGIESSVKVFGSALPSQLGAAPPVFASFSPYPGDATGVTIASGLVDAVSGRFSIVTAPGAGSASRIKTFRFDLYRPNTGPSAWCAPRDPLPPDVPRVTSDFVAFDGNYSGGVSLATGWVGGGKYGGAESIVIAEDSAPGVVKIFSSGSALDGEPDIYLKSPDEHDTKVEFREVSSFTPFGDAPSAGVRVATTSTTAGADVLVSGLDATGSAVRVRKFGMERTAAAARTLSPKVLGDIESAAGTAPSSLGGD
jgi:FtsP/CotA-like multicopper oxidase with cupredoxin domain